ncbi:MAG: HPr family phosphocarrier protein [Kofleriaceae bacterium]|nr:HPr family phosphocarrier protein [Myxococcales bacterium]MCB9558776.1 HPr family phosphocarrier protein [Kofleriaceae bacterium]MCB9570670.1 HPr family phosphocarrier protein [Kofleriaceae bacterium]
MATDQAERTLTISNELGMHARAATKFVQLAGKYPCDIVVSKDGHDVNGKSIMGVLMLVASKGSQITIRGKGDQADAAVAALAQLVDDKFGEDR